MQCQFSKIRLGRFDSEAAAAIAWKFEYDRRKGMTAEEWKQQPKINITPKNMLGTPPPPPPLSVVLPGAPSPIPSAASASDPASAQESIANNKSKKATHIPCVKKCIVEKVIVDGKEHEVYVNIKHKNRSTSKYKGVSRTNAGSWSAKMVRRHTNFSGNARERGCSSGCVAERIREEKV